MKSPISADQKLRDRAVMAAILLVVCDGSEDRHAIHATAMASVATFRAWDQIAPDPAPPQTGRA